MSKSYTFSRMAEQSAGRFAASVSLGHTSAVHGRKTGYSRAPLSAPAGRFLREWAQFLLPNRPAGVGAGLIVGSRAGL